MRLVHLGALVLVSLGCGCGGGGDGSGEASSEGQAFTSFTSGVSGDARLASLDDTDQTELCDEVDAYAARLRSSLGSDACRVTGLLQAGVVATENGAASDRALRSACTVAYDACVSAAQASDAGLPPSVCAAAKAAFTRCRATVAEVSACINGAVGRFTSAVERLSACGTVTRASLAPSLSFDCGPIPPSCAALQSDCPDLVTMATTLGG